MRNPVRQSEKD